MSSELTKEQLEEFRLVFDEFDRDHGGTIDKEELGAAMRSLGQNPTNMELQDMITAVDIDNSGTIDFPEFLEMMANKIKDSDTIEDLKEAFSLFDKEHNGTVNVRELKLALKKLGESMTDEEIEYCFQRLPQTDGCLVIEEVSSILLS